MPPREFDEEKRSQGSYQERSASLREALRSKVGEEKPTDAPLRATAVEIGAVAPEEESLMDRPLTLGGPSYLDLAVFCRQFATLIEVGLPVLRALQILSARTSNGRLRKAIRETAQGIEEGQLIHQAMNRHARTFTPLVINIVRIGETGGLLESSLVRLAEIMEAKARIKRKVLSASMYPMVALCVAIAVVVLILVKAIPIFSDVYSQAGAKLPPTTQFVIDLSNFFKGAWWILLILLVAAIIGLKMWAWTPAGQRTYSWLGLHLPVFAGITQKMAVARSTRTLGGLVSAGIPLVDALAITADTNENLVVADAFREIHDQVEKGGRMADPLHRAKIFPPLVVDMIAIGEETGTLDRMLIKVADIYDVEVDAMLNGLSSIIEPVLIIFLGGVVIFIALAVLLPYFNMAQIVQ